MKVKPLPLYSVVEFGPWGDFDLEFLLCSVGCPDHECLALLSVISGNSG